MRGGAPFFASRLVGLEGALTACATTGRVLAFGRAAAALRRFGVAARTAFGVLVVGRVGVLVAVLVVRRFGIVSFGRFGTESFGSFRVRVDVERP